VVCEYGSPEPKEVAVTTAAGPAIRIVQPTGAPAVVLAGNNGTLTGETWLVNEGSEPVKVETAAIVADIPVVPGRVRQAVELENWIPLVVRPGHPERVTLSASLDPLTPPGSHRAAIIFVGVEHRAILEITKLVSLSVDPSELIIDGDPGTQQVEHIVVTNSGNVPLPVSQLGPVTLVRDRPRPSLAQRLGLFPLAFDEPQKCDEHGDRMQGEDEEPTPSVIARVVDPVIVAPGEARRLELVFSIHGAVRAGLRYRASAALYDDDITFVVTPHQETTAARAQPGRRRKTPARAPQQPSSERSASRNRGNS
jgi:hypothetical protein